MGRFGDSEPVKRVLQNLALLGATLVVVLFALEALARLLLPAHPIYRYPQPRHDPDPVLNWVLRPNQDAFTQDRALRVNGAGLRDDEELPEIKPPGELRVLLIGDSFTFGNGVSTPETYAERLEALLRERDRRVRVLNGGVQGYDTHQEADWLRRRGLALQPDVVVVGLYENDVTLRPTSPPVFPDLLEDTWVRPAIYTVKRLRVAVYVSSLIREARWRLFPPRSNYHVRAFFFSEPSPESERAWSDVETSLAAIRDAAREVGTETFVLLFPHRLQLEESPLEQTYRQRALAIGRDLGLDVVDLLPSYREAARSGSSPYIAYDGHPNAVGHELAARAIAGPVSAALERRRAGREP